MITGGARWGVSKSMQAQFGEQIFHFQKLRVSRDGGEGGEGGRIFNTLASSAMTSGGARCGVSKSMQAQFAELVFSFPKIKSVARWRRRGRRRTDFQYLGVECYDLGGARCGVSKSMQAQFAELVFHFHKKRVSRDGGEGGEGGKIHHRHMILAESRSKRNQFAAEVNARTTTKSPGIRIHVYASTICGADFLFPEEKSVARRGNLPLSRPYTVPASHRRERNHLAAAACAMTTSGSRCSASK